MLSSTLPSKREEGAALLGQQGDTTAAKKLVAMLDDPDWGVQMAAIRALAPIPFEPGRDAIREKAVEGKIRAIRTLAARSPQEHDAARAASRIANNLTRLKKEARLPAIEALGIPGTPEAIEGLADQMKAPEPEHRIAAAIRGRIINLSSKNGLVAEAGLAHYNAAKGAIELLTWSTCTSSPSPCSSCCSARWPRCASSW